VTTSRRSALAPDLPTIEETLRLKDFDLAAWTGFFAPAGLPRDIQEKLSGALLRILARPDVRERILAAGAEPTPSDIPTFTALVRRQLDIWGRKVADAGIQPE
jgi:tripartite-type tricarboxylate transporter receptor subunit TctC